MRSHYILCLISFLFWARFSFAQEQPVYHAIDHTKWEKATKGRDYIEQEEEEKEIQMPAQKTPFSINGTLVKVLIYSAIAALIIFILIRLFGKNLFNKKKKIQGEAFTLTALDEHPMESDLDRFLREALEQKDYRLAIRIYYLMTLRVLHDRNIITWKKNKTNMDYLSDLMNHPDYQQMANNTLIYEFVWYGEKLIIEPQFRSISGSFTGLLKKMSEEK